MLRHKQVSSAGTSFAGAATSLGGRGTTYAVTADALADASRSGRASPSPAVAAGATSLTGEPVLTFCLAGIKCRFEFCWECGADHVQIMRRDNSAHKPSCKFHPVNLHTRSPYDPLDYYDGEE